MTDTTNPTTPDQGDERRASVYDAIKTMRNLGVSLNDYDSAALELLIQWSEDVLSAAQPVAQEASEHYDELKATLQGVHTLCENISGMERRVGPLGSHARGYTHKITKALRHLDALAALAAPQPSQGAQPVVDQEPASMSDNGSCGSQVSGKPASAEAGKGVAWQVRRTDGSPLATWEHCTEEAYKATLANGRYCGFENGPPCEARALCVSPSESVAVSASPSALPAQAVGEVTDAMRKAFDDRKNSLEADERDGIIAAILALAAPMPQAEPTSKGEAWNMEKLTNILRTYGHSGLLDAINFEIAEASQQREPQEAAERPASAYRREAVETIKALGYQWADGKWSAPQEAGKGDGNG